MARGFKGTGHPGFEEEGGPGDGALSEDVRLNLPNIDTTLRQALRLLTAYTDDSAASEDSTFTIYVIKAGSPVAALVVHGNGITVPAGDFTNPGVKVGTQLLFDDGTFLRIGARGHYIGNDVWLLNPNTADGAGYYLDTGLASGLKRLGAGAVLRAGSVDVLAALAATLTAAVPILHSDGSAGAPSNAMASDPDTGWFYAGSGIQGHSINGQLLLYFGDANYGVRVFHRIQGSRAADVASASTITLGSANYQYVTGTTDINFITTTGWQDGARVSLRFVDGPVLNHLAASPPANTAPIYLRTGLNGQRQGVFTFTYDLKAGAPGLWREDGSDS